MTQVKEMEEHIKELRSTINFLTDQIRTTIDLLERNEQVFAIFKLKDALDNNRFRYR